MNSTQPRTESIFRLQNVTTAITDSLILLSRGADPTFNVQQARTSVVKWFEDYGWNVPEVSDIEQYTGTAEEALYKALIDVVGSRLHAADHGLSYHALVYALIGLNSALKTLAKETTK